MDQNLENSPTTNLEGFEIRYTELSDAKYLRDWLKEPTVWRWFPMFDEVEIEDAVQRWIGFARYKCSLTADNAWRAMRHRHSLLATLP